MAKKSKKFSDIFAIYPLTITSKAEAFKVFKNKPELEYAMLQHSMFSGTRKFLDGLGADVRVEPISLTTTGKDGKEQDMKCVAIVVKPKEIMGLVKNRAKLVLDGDEVVN